MNTMFVWKDKNSMEVMSTALQKCVMIKGKNYPLAISNIWKYTSVKDTNKKVICSQDLYNKMDDKHRSYFIFVQNPAKLNEVHV